MKGSSEIPSISLQVIANLTVVFANERLIEDGGQSEAKFLLNILSPPPPPLSLTMLLC